MFSAEAIQTFLSVLPKAGMGWLGVFVVTIVIILGAELLNYFTRGWQDKK